MKLWVFEKWGKNNRGNSFFIFCLHKKKKKCNSRKIKLIIFSISSIQKIKNKGILLNPQKFSFLFCFYVFYLTNRIWKLFHIEFFFFLQNVLELLYNLYPNTFLLSFTVPPITTILNFRCTLKIPCNLIHLLIFEKETTLFRKKEFYDIHFKYYFFFFFLPSRQKNNWIFEVTNNYN